MIACVSPARTVRSTPRRISLAPVSVWTLTCRSRISSVAMPVSLLLGSVLSLGGGRGVVRTDGAGGVDVNVVALDRHGIDVHRGDGGQSGRLTGAQVETRAVEPAFDR